MEGLNENMKIFALPYAVASSGMYYQLKRELSPNHTLVPMEYPGHGTRISEELLPDIHSMAEDAYSQLLKENISQPYGLFGYSMGTLVAHELYYLLLANKRPLPSILFMCAASSPQAKREQKNISEMTDLQLIEELRLLQGTESEVLEDKELLGMILPIARADLSAAEKYLGDINRPQISSNVVVLYSDEEAQEADIGLWSDISSKPVVFLKLSGGHFFIHSGLHKVSALIEEHIRNIKVI